MRKEARHTQMRDRASGVHLDVLEHLPSSLVAQMVKNLPTIWETRVRSLGQEGSLEEGMATHSSILAWRIPWTEDQEGYSPWGHKESNMTEHLKHTHPCPEPSMSHLMDSLGSSR